MKVDIQGYEGLYQVDTDGNVYSLRRDIILKQRCDKDGYKRVNFVKNKIHKTVSVHRLVAEHFILNLQNKPQVNHVDGNKKNNNIKNLEWVTSKENILHAYIVLNRQGSSFPGRNNKSNKHGYQGVAKGRAGLANSYFARICINGSIKYLGAFKTAKEAGEAYQKEALKHSKNK